LNPNEQDLDIDVNSIFGDSTVRVKTLADHCKWESTFCKPCFSTAAVDGCVTGCVSEIKAADIFNHTKYYATFAKLDSDVAGKLFDQLGFPESMKVKQRFEKYLTNAFDFSFSLFCFN
jgi:hypothetical protein